MIAYKFDHLWSEPQYESLLGGAVTCSEGFVTVFLKVPLACLGSMAAAVQQLAIITISGSIIAKIFETDRDNCNHCTILMFYIKLISAQQNTIHV